MSRMSRSRLSPRRVVAAVGTLALAAFGSLVVAPTADAALYCGSSKFVKEIKVVKWAGDKFQIVLTPNGAARRHAAFADNPRDAVVEQWHAIQRCVPGLRDGLADTIWDQLECHQVNSWIVWKREGSWWATGDSYELESWRPVLPRWLPGGALIVTECLNRLGVDPDGPHGKGIRPDKGQADLRKALSTTA